MNVITKKKEISFISEKTRLFVKHAA